MEDIINRLSKLSLFSEIKDDRDALIKIASVIKTERFKPNANVIKEGDIGDKMYILNAGTVRIEKQTLSGDTFPVANLSEKMNVFFGEVALMDNDVRSASVSAISEVECFVISKKEFDKICDNDPRIGYYIFKEIAKTLSNRLRKSTLDNINLIAALING